MADSRKTRYVLAAVLTCSIIGAAAWGLVRERASSSVPRWSNPISNQSAQPFPAGWRSLPTAKDMPDNTWLFGDATRQQVVAIGYEKTDLPIADYVEALMSGAPTMSLIHNGKVGLEGTRQVWSGDGAGKSTDAPSGLAVRAHVFRGDGGYWRVIEMVPETSRADADLLEPLIFRAVLATTQP